MKVCVYGLGHQGMVTAAGLASLGFDVSGVEPMSYPEEPGLDRLLKSKRLRIEVDLKTGLREADILWIAFDTPIDDQDRPDAGWVLEKARKALPLMPKDCAVLVSSQLPAGSTAKLGAAVAYSPENLRLGSAVECFLKPERIVVGARPGRRREALERLFKPFKRPVLWMSVESAEMTKHALNAFLASSVAFANEIAGLCEAVGADAAEVERALKSDSRVGPGAYVRAGAAFSGGTLARDLRALTALKGKTPLLRAVLESNEAHKSWVKRRLPKVKGKKIAVLGLAYKPGTSSVKRSLALELCLSLKAAGARVQAYDPEVRAGGSMDSALKGASALVVANPCPEFKSLTAARVVRLMRSPLVLDPSRFLEAELGSRPPIRYFAVGRPS